MSLLKIEVEYIIDCNFKQGEEDTKNKLLKHFKYFLNLTLEKIINYFKMCLLYFQPPPPILSHIYAYATLNNYQTEPALILSMYFIAISIFLVNIPAANPYLVLLARFITSSNVLNLIIC